jgi:hypothetical protein
MIFSGNLHGLAGKMPDAGLALRDGAKVGSA